MKTVEIFNASTNIVQCKSSVKAGNMYLLPGDRLPVPITNGGTFTFYMASLPNQNVITEESGMPSGRKMLVYDGGTNYPMTMDVTSGAWESFNYGWQTGLAVLGVALIIWMVQRLRGGGVYESD